MRDERWEIGDGRWEMGDGRQETRSLVSEGTALRLAGLMTQGVEDSTMRATANLHVSNYP